MHIGVPRHLLLPDWVWTPCRECVFRSLGVPECQQFCAHWHHLVRLSKPQQNWRKCSLTPSARGSLIRSLIRLDYLITLLCPLIAALERSPESGVEEVKYPIQIVSVRERNHDFPATSSGCNPNCCIQSGGE